MLWNVFNAATRDFQQSGASASGTSGGTDLISKNLTSHVLSFASEYGALTQSTSGQTTTVNGTLDGIPLALEAHTGGLFAECGVKLSDASDCLPTKWFDSLGRVSYSVSLDSSPGTQLSGTTVGTPQGIPQQAALNTTGSPTHASQITGKIVLLQPPSTFKAFTTALSKLDTSKGTPLIAAQKTLDGYQENAAAYVSWVDKQVHDLSQLDADKVVGAWRALGTGLLRVLEDAQPGQKGPSEDEIIQAAVTFAAAYASFNAAERTVLGPKIGKPLLTFEYDDNRPLNQPSNSVLRLIYGQTVAKNWTLTGNAAVSIYNSTPSSSIPGASRLRDVQAGFEADRGLGSLWILGPATASGAYYFQHQSSPAILNITPSEPIDGISFTGLPSTQVFAQKGNISVAQARIALGSSSASWKFPISVTWSNRTELITKPTWRAQVGITYDFDSLLGIGK
jgi:hypothetical protein